LWGAAAFLRILGLPEEALLSALPDESRKQATWVSRIPSTVQDAAIRKPRLRESYLIKLTFYEDAPLP